MSNQPIYSFLLLLFGFFLHSSLAQEQSQEQAQKGYEPESNYSSTAKPQTQSNLSGLKKKSSFEKNQKKLFTSFSAKYSAQARQSKSLIERVKSFVRKSVRAIKEKIFSLKQKSERKPASFMSVKANEFSCKPQIIHQMVYQSVEAPQIETLNKQEFQPDPNNPVFKSYDLVRGKSAGVVVKISYPEVCHLNDKSFALGMEIDNQPVEIKCLSFLKNNPWELSFSNSVPNELSCSFSIQEFSTTSTLLRFIELPVDVLDKNRRNMPVRVNLLDEKGQMVSNETQVLINDRNLEKLSRCQWVIDLYSANKFCLDMHVTKNLSLGVVPITGVCRGEDLSTDDNAVEIFIQSEELKDYLPVIFPVPEPQTIEDIIEPLKLKHIRKYAIPIKRKPLFHINQGRSPEDRWLSSPSCDNRPVWPNNLGREWSYGLIEMIRIFNGLIRKSSKNRIALLVSRAFMDYHNVPAETVGFVWSYNGRPSHRRILFVNENYRDTGTLLHETAHGIGQLKEFYKTLSKCKKFNGSLEVSCKDQYFIQRGLRARKGGLFHWVSGSFESIMYFANNISQKWIDRETYQKAFRFLKSSSTRSEAQENFKQQPKLIVSGLYNKDSNELTDLEIESLSPDSAEISPSLRDGLSDEGELNYIKIQLVKNNEPVYEVRHPADMFAEIYRADGEYETISLPTTLIHAVIPIIGEGEFKIHFFKGTFWFNQEGEVLERTGEEELSQEMNFTWPER